MRQTCYVFQYRFLHSARENEAGDMCDRAMRLAVLPVSDEADSDGGLAGFKAGSEDDD